MRVHRLGYGRFLLPMICALGACGSRDGTDTSSVACHLSPDPRVEIGGVEPPEHVFGDVVDATRLSDGRIAVVDRQASTVTLFSSQGEALDSLGRDGEGPGEFLDPIAVDHAGSKLAVWDWDQVRVTEFDLATSEVSVVRAEGVLNPTHHFGIYEDGFIVGSVRTGAIPSNGLGERILRILRIERSGTEPDTIIRFTERRSGWVDQDARFVGSPTFGPRGTFTVSPQGVYWTTGDSAVVHQMSGDQRQRLTWTWDARPVSDEDLDSYRNQRLEGASGGMRDMLETQYEVMPVADNFPVASDLSPDRDGGVWVGIYPRPGDSTRLWLRINEEGVGCSVVLPRTLEVVEGGSDWLLGYDEDALGVQSVQLWSYEPVS